LTIDIISRRGYVNFVAKKEHTRRNNKKEDIKHV